MGIPIHVPTRSELENLLDYNPWTGSLFWRRGKLSGKLAGTISVGRPDKSNRYLRVGIKTDKRRQYPAHRLIWMIMTGDQPPDVIDHRDGNPLNLRWDNLREATNGQNIQNSKLRKDNKSGVKGVCWEPDRRKWVAIISVDGRHIRLGRFNTVSEAEHIINSARIRLHGEFARSS